MYHVFKDFHYWDVMNALVRAMFRNNWAERKQAKLEEKFNEFDDVLEDMFTKAQDARISMCELVRKEMRKNYNKLRSQVDRNKDGDAYDSRYVILVPRLIPRIRKFLERARARRAAANAEQQDLPPLMPNHAEVDALLDVSPMPKPDLMEPTMPGGTVRTFSGSTMTSHLIKRNSAFLSRQSTGETMLTNNRDQVALSEALLQMQNRDQLTSVGMDHRGSFGGKLPENASSLERQI